MNELKRKIWYFLTEGNANVKDTRNICRASSSDVCQKCTRIKMELFKIIDDEVQRIHLGVKK